MRYFVCNLLVLLQIALAARAWGPGHDPIQREIMTRLPRELVYQLDQAYIQKLITYYSHYPDSFEPFDVADIGEESIARLRRYNITKRYDLHHDRNRAIGFLELVHALRDKDYKKANFWIACLAHSAADMSALNHDPMTHIVYYVWGQEKNLAKTASGNSPQYFDLHDVVSEPEGLRIFRERIVALKLKNRSMDLNTILTEIMLYGHEGAHFLATRGFDVLDGSIRYADTQKHEFKSRVFTNMADLGAWAVVRILRDVTLAQRLAETRLSLEFPEEVEIVYRQKVEELLKNRPLDDGMFQSVLAAQAGGNTPATGILIEPSWRMNDGLIGFRERILSVEISNSLRKQNRPFQLVDVRAVLQHGFPDPKQMPVVILPVRNSRAVYQGMNLADLVTHLGDYQRLGGKIIWIGGDLPAVLAPSLSSSADSQTLPLSTEQLQAATLKVIGQPSLLPFEGALKPKVGWQVVSSSFVGDPQNPDKTGMIPLVEAITADGRAAVVGSAWPAEAPKLVYLPAYALVPFLLTKEPIIPTRIETASLDSVGTQLLMQSLDLVQAP